MPPSTLVTMPREIHGYTVLSIKAALLRDNVLYSTFSSNKVIVFVHCTVQQCTKTKL